MLQKLSPRLFARISAILTELREDLADNGGSGIPFDARTTLTIVVSCVLLTVYYYYGRPGFFQNNFDPAVAAWLGMTDSPHRDLLRYAYWAFSSTLIRVAIPLALIVWWFKESPRDYGFRRWEKGHGKIYLMMYLAMLPLLTAASFLPSFQDKYPFYDGAAESLFHFFAYQFAYGTQFFALEAFFRGFIVFALFKRFGYYSILIMTIPYCLIHFGKPMPETLGSIIAGILLGYCAIKSRSFLPGALLHFAVGFTMDVACILQRAGL